MGYALTSSSSALCKLYCYLYFGFYYTNNNYNFYISKLIYETVQAVQT